MAPNQKSFADRIARIEQAKGVSAAPAETAPPRAELRPVTKPASRGLPMAVHALTLVFVLLGGFGAAFMLGGPEFKLRVISLFVPGFGQVHVADEAAPAEDRYNWDAKITPFNAAKIGLQRMNAFEQDMSNMEMRELIRRAEKLGQPFLAQEIERKMTACDTLICRNELENKYDAQLKKLRKSTPTW